MSKDKKILNKVKDWLNANIEAKITVDLIKDNKDLLEFIKKWENKMDNISEEYMDQQTDNEFMEPNGTVPVRKNMELSIKNIEDFAIIISDDEEYGTAEEGMATWLYGLIEGNVSVDELRNQFYLYLKYKDVNKALKHGFMFREE